MHSILSKQNEPAQVALLKAAAVAYTRAKYFEVVFLRIMFFLAVCVPLVYLFMRTQQAKLFLGLAGFGVSILIQLLSTIIKSNVQRGAIFKEKFDQTLFGLRWKSTIAHPDPMEVDRYALAYGHKNMQDWYPGTLDASLPNEICIAACQRINAEWDIWVRTSFCRFLYIVISIHSLLLLAAVIYFNPTGLNILPIFFSCLSFYLYFINQVRGHHSIIETRKKLSALLDNYLLEKHLLPDSELLRDVQDEIYATRKQPTLAPDFYYRIFHKPMQRAVDRYVEEINAAWKTN